MATDNTYKIARYGDRKWIDVFLSAIQRSMINNANFSGISGIQAITVSDPSHLPELLDFISKNNACILRSVTASISGLTISVIRTDSVLYDELKFYWNPKNQQAHLSDQQRAEIISWFTSELLELDPDRGLFSSTDISEAAQNELALRSATIERFEQVQAKLAEDTAAFNKTIQENYLAEKSKLDALLEAEREKLDKEFRNKSENLDKRSAQLDERESAIDSSDNTAARRQIRKDLLDELKKRSEVFVLTTGTKSLRWPVHVVSLAIIIGGLVGAFFFGSYIPNAQSATTITSIIPLIKSLGLTFVSVGTAFFYLRWLNRWFEQHAQAEFSLKQFQLDIERASWLVETALDWDAKKEKELPKELLEGLSKNLFNSEGEAIDQIRHPVDELASALMGSASKVRLNLGGNEVELDGKRLSKTEIKG